MDTLTLRNIIGTFWNLFELCIINGLKTHLTISFLEIKNRYEQIEKPKILLYKENFASLNSYLFIDQSIFKLLL